MDDDRTRGLGTGLVLIVVGTILLIQQMGWVPGWHIYQVWHLWPLILIAVGLTRLASPRREGRYGSGLWILLTGILFMLDTTHVLPMDRSWPLFIVAGGLGMLFGRSATFGWGTRRGAGRSSTETGPNPPEQK